MNFHGKLSSFIMWSFLRFLGIGKPNLKPSICTISTDTGHVTLPVGTKAIKNHEFSDFTALISIFIPTSIETIGSCAFHNCIRLTTIIIPVGVKDIQFYAFKGCRSLKSIILPDSVKTIHPCAFSGCISLTSVVIPVGVQIIGFDAFKGCESLKGVTVPDGVIIIERSTFFGCTGLKGVTIPGSVQLIKCGAFSGCTGLTSAVIPVGVKSIQYEAFRGCKSLTSVVIPSSVDFIDEAAFEDCISIRRVFDATPSNLGKPLRPLVYIGPNDDSPDDREHYFLATHWDRKSPKDMTPSQRLSILTFLLCYNRSILVRSTLPRIPIEMIEFIFNELPR
jgi:hypothetical protein